MGIPIPAAKQMSLWEMAAAAERWIEAHDTEGQDRKGQLDEGEKDEIWAWMQSKPQSPLTRKAARAKTNGAGH